MQKIGIFYGSSTGNSEAAAQQLQKEFGAEVATIYDVSSAKGSELEYDFEDFLPEIKSANLKDKKVAIFGLGDQESYPDSFVDSIGITYEAIKDKGCQLVGKVSTDGYDYDESRGEVDGEFLGLPLDEDNQGDLTNERIKNWVEQLKGEFN